MKKVIFIVFGILFGFQSNMFSYTWNVYNFTGENNISVHFCTTSGINNCQDATIPVGTTHTFAFNDWYNKGLFFGSAIVNNKSFSSDDFNAQTDSTRVAGGNIRVVKDSSGSYAFEVN